MALNNHKINTKLSKIMLYCTMQYMHKKAKKRFLA